LHFSSTLFVFFFVFFYLLEDFPVKIIVTLLLVTVESVT
jgi:hypothetical protein